MNANPFPLLSLRSLVALFLFGLGSGAFGQSVSTTPVGAMTLTISAAPSSQTPRYTSLALPLLNEPLYSGKLVSVSSNTISVAQVVGVAISSSNPYFIRITSGVNQGLTLLVTSNNGSTLSLDTSRTGVLTSLATPLVAGDAGDSYALYPADTLLSLFGSAVLGASTASAADQVWIWQPAAGSYSKFYYNTTNNRWQDTDFDDPANNTVLLPDAGLMFLRRGTTALSLKLAGSVPATDAKTQLRNSGYTFFSSGFPVAVTLNGLGLQTNSNWVKSSGFSLADQVWVWQPASGSYAKYFYNSASNRWEDSDFGDPAGLIAINPQTPIMIKRFVSGQTTYTTYSMAKPYSL